jgi:hypothetical protein
LARGARRTAGPERAAQASSGPSSGRRQSGSLARTQGDGSGLERARTARRFERGQARLGAGAARAGERSVHRRTVRAQSGTGVSEQAAGGSRLQHAWARETQACWRERAPSGSWAQCRAARAQRWFGSAQTRGSPGMDAEAGAGATWRRVRERTARSALECKRWSVGAGLGQASGAASGVGATDRRAWRHGSTRRW